MLQRDDPSYNPLSSSPGLFITILQPSVRVSAASRGLCRGRIDPVSLLLSLSHENICLQIAESGSRWIHLFSLQSDLKEYQQRWRHDVSARFFSFNVLLMSDKVKNWCTWTRSIFFPRPGALFVEHLLLAEFKATERKLECLWLSLALSALCSLRGSVQISGNMRLRRKYNPATFRPCT